MASDDELVLSDNEEMDTLFGGDAPRTLMLSDDDNPFSQAAAAAPPPTHKARACRRNLLHRRCARTAVETGRDRTAGRRRPTRSQSRRQRQRQQQQRHRPRARSVARTTSVYALNIAPGPAPNSQ